MGVWSEQGEKPFQNLTSENGILRTRDWLLWRWQLSWPEDRKWKDTFVPFKGLSPKSFALGQVFPGKAPFPAPPGFPSAFIIIFRSCLLRWLPLILNLPHVASFWAKASAKNKIYSSTNTSRLTCFLSTLESRLRSHAQRHAMGNEVLNPMTLENTRCSGLLFVCET